jgi:SOS-response transcriptional repressor LexA
MLTKKQTIVFNAIKDYIAEQEISPTVRELCSITGVKYISTMHGYLDRLQRDGYISRQFNSARSIRVIKQRL